MQHNFPPGFRFRPTDQELVKDYLLRKVRGEGLPWDGIKFCDLYGDKSPWEIFQAFGHEDEESLYVFTRLKKVGTNRVSRIAGCGSWHGETSITEIYDDMKKNRVIGSKKTFTFKVKNEPKKSHWIMHEFSLAGEFLMENKNCSDYVLCRIHKKVVSGNRSNSIEKSCIGVEFQNQISLEQEGFGDNRRVNQSVDETLNSNQEIGAIMASSHSQQAGASMSFSCYAENRVGNQAGYPPEDCHSFTMQKLFVDAPQCNYMEPEFNSTREQNVFAFEEYSSILQGCELRPIENPDVLSPHECEVLRFEFGSTEDPDLGREQVNTNEDWNISELEYEQMQMEEDNLLLPIQESNNDEVEMMVEPELPSLGSVTTDWSFLSGFQHPIQESAAAAATTTTTTNEVERSCFESDSGFGDEFADSMLEDCSMLGNNNWSLKMNLEELLWDIHDQKISDDQVSRIERYQS